MIRKYPTPPANGNLGSRVWGRILSICDTWHHLVKNRTSGFLIIALLTLAGLLVAVAGNLGEELVSAILKGERSDLRAAVAIVGLLGISFLLMNLAWTLRESFATLGEVTFASCAEPRSVLIFFVSRQNLLKEIVADQGALKVSSVILPRGSLIEDADALAKAEVLNPHSGRMSKLIFSWEMILRGIHPHYDSGTLKRVYLVGSSPGVNILLDPGTFCELDNCAAFLNPYLPGVEIIPWQEHRDFEVVAEVAGMLRSLIEDEIKRNGTSEHDICIDFTGGQKPSSAAAALVTLNRNITIQYVQTNAPKEAHRYDLSYRNAPNGAVIG